MSYKHKFILTTKQGVKMELATCGDLMTANFLTDHFTRLYDNGNFTLTYSHGRNTSVLSDIKEQTQ